MYDKRKAMLEANYSILDPREALDRTLKSYKIKASDLSKLTGVAPDEISKYRNQHKDMNSVTVFKLVNALPYNARNYFYHLCSFGAPDKVG